MTDLVVNALPALLTPLGVVVAVAVARRVLRELVGV